MPGRDDVPGPADAGSARDDGGGSGATSHEVADSVGPLLALGVERRTAVALAARYSPARVQEVAEAARNHARRNPAGWAIRALQGGWTVTPTERPPAALAPDTRPPSTSAPDAEGYPEVEDRWQAWDRAVSAALDDDQLAGAIDLACATLPPASRIGPTIRVQLICWAAQNLDHAGGQDLSSTIAAALVDHGHPAVPAEPVRPLPPPPTAGGWAPPLRERITAQIRTSCAEGRLR